MRTFYFRNPRGRFSPSPKLRKIKYGFALILVVFLYFPTFSEPHDEIPKKRRAWDSNPRATSAVLSRAFTSGATTRPQPRLRVKGVHIAVMCGRTLKKWRISQSGDCKMTTLWRRNRFLKVTIWRLPFGGTFWLAGFAGRRFLVLIIKVTLSELSEASAPSTNNFY